MLGTLHYFAFFKHALYVEEVWKYLGVKATAEEVEAELAALENQGHVATKDGLWALDAAHLDIRLMHVGRNEKMLRAARRMGRLIQCFPYVRGVYLSGSLSKEGVTGADDDLDFFIITKAGRVWAAKFLLIAFKKVFLLNKEKYFCINFLMAENHLELAKRNIYIATEAASLLPLTNAPLLSKFFAENAWVAEYFPNFEFPEVKSMRSRAGILEAVLELFFGAKLEAKAHRMFVQHVEEKRRDSGYYDTSEEVSAYFPESVEEQLLHHLEKNIFEHE